MTLAHSFAPVIAKGARLLVLGSMPGKVSLAAHQYYAHPRNLFWPFMSALVGVDELADYQSRCERLTAQRVAVWDVLQSCERSSSLDADIVENSMVPNNFEALLGAYPSIHTIVFNGAKAQQVFMRYVMPDIQPKLSGITLTKLPSTSPANAGIARDAKLAAWRHAFKCITSNA